MIPARWPQHCVRTVRRHRAERVQRPGSSQSTIPTAARFSPPNIVSCPLIRSVLCSWFPSTAINPKLRECFAAIKSAFCSSHSKDVRHRGHLYHEPLLSGLLRLHIDVLSVDDAFVFFLLFSLSGIAARSCSAGLCAASWRGRFVHRLSQLVRSLR